MSSFVPKRCAATVPWFLAVAAFLLVAAAPVLGATSAQQVYEAPGTGQTPSPLPGLPIPPAGEVQRPAPFTPRAVPGPLVAGSRVPVATSSPCIPATQAAPGTVSGARPGTPADAEECAPPPGDGTAVRNAVTPNPGQSTPVGRVASGSGPASAAGGSGTLPVTGLDLFIVLAAAATAAGVGLSLRKAAAR